MSGFESARDAMEEGITSATSQETNQTDQTQAIHEEAKTLSELEKMDRFKFQGQEWTAKDLEKAILRQKDYTQKTQGLSADRKSFDEERKFYENLAYDLLYVKNNPSLAQKFVEIYPEKFHSYLENILKNQTEQTQTHAVQRPQVDVQLMSRLQTVEKFYHEQETQRNETEIERYKVEFFKKYPEADGEKVMARTYEAYLQSKEAGLPFSLKETMENFFKQSHAQEEDRFKAKYSQYVKKQTEANAKGRGDGAGGGVPGQAPKKFKRIEDIKQHAIESLTRR